MESIGAVRPTKAATPHGRASEGRRGSATPILGLAPATWLLLLAVIGLINPVWRAIAAGPTDFDDAYMFWRYAINVREGLGIAWNPDGLQTYGLTSHLWLLVTLPFTFLPLHPGYALPLASALAAYAAIAIMTLTVSGEARSELLRDKRWALGVVSIPLLLNPFFTFHFSTGMDTMASMAANALVVMAVFRYVGQPSLARAAFTGVVAFVAVLTRPENGVCALGVPFLAFVWMWRRDRWLDLAGLALLPVALIGCTLIVCYLVFGVPLPLSFYAKSLHSYSGFQNPENAVQYLFLGLLMAMPFMALAIASGRRCDVAFFIAILLPVALTFAYLLTMRQVMGWVGRYYVPFLPYIIIPAVMMLDRRLSELGGDVRPLLRRIGAALGVLIGVVIVTWPAQRGLEAAYSKLIIPERIAMPQLATASSQSVPKHDWFTIIQQISGEIVKPLPADAVIAASEVGYLGASNTRVTLVDLVGLNDTTIARKGFSMDYLLSRHPDFIWIPFHDYSGLVATILSDPRLHERYIVVRDAFNYGIAIRRDGPHRQQIEAGARKSWAVLYPSLRFDDFIVRR